MPIILAILAALGGAYIWYIRAQNAKEGLETLADAATDVRLAARRFGFRRKANVHPAESVDDTRLVVISITAAMAQMDEQWSKDLSDELTVQAQRVFGVGHADAQEMVVFSKWLSDQSSTFAEMVRRLAKQLASLGDDGSRQDLAEVIQAVCTDQDGHLSENVTEALATVNRHLR